MATPGDKKNNDVIELSQFRASLARSRSKRRADVILSQPHPELLVPRLAMQELYYAIKEVGLRDAADLLALTTATQIRGFIDLEVWKGDTLDVERLDPWLEALTDISPEKVAEAIEGMDPELIALYIQRNVAVYDITLEEQIPDEPQGHYFPTPDRFFMLDILQPGSRGKLVEHLIDWMYRSPDGLALARRVLMSSKWELDSDLQEWAYRWRAGRMADLGYVDYYDALVVYRYIEPAHVKLADDNGAFPEVTSRELPALYAGAIDTQGVFGRTLAQIEDPIELERLYGALLTLINKVMAADRIEAWELDVAQKTLERSVRYLNLGLEYLGRGELLRSKEALVKLPLQTLFRLGYSLTLQLQRLAHTLTKKGRVVVGELQLADEPYRSLLGALTQRHPLYLSALDNPGAFEQAAIDAAQADLEPAKLRPFASLVDISRAAAALKTLADMAAFVFDTLGVNPESLKKVPVLSAPASDIRFGTLIRTIASNVLLDRKGSLEPLAAADFSALRAQTENGELTAAARAKIERALEARLASRQQKPPAQIAAWLTSWLAHFSARLNEPSGVLLRL